MSDPLLNVGQAADYLGCGVSTLNKLRMNGGGPIFKIGARVMYSSADLDRYIAKCRRQSTAQGKAA
jgi:excisionase family DNA binding protein